MVFAKLGFIVTAFFCAIVYFTDFLVDLDFNPLKQRNNIQLSDEFKLPDDKDFINQISLVKISGSANASNCLLPHLDPWDSVIRKYLKPDTDPLKKCKSSIEVRSSISYDGRLSVTPADDNEKCSYRCLHPVDDRNLQFANWVDIAERVNETTYEARPECDVFDVKCTLNSLITYKYMHSHIYEKNPRLTPPTQPQPFSSHIILLDSVSMSQIYRSLPMTVHFIRTELDAIPMPFLNKVGLNSRPNGYAFLLNERASNLPQNPWGQKLQGGRGDEMCRKSLNNETFIGYDFQNSGYRTLLNEDWAMGIFTYPSCKGFSKPPVDHFLKPYMLRVDGAGYREAGYREILFKKACRERHKYIFENFRNFLHKYPNEPKFSLNWITDLAHDNMNGLYHADNYFREFFREMMPKLKDSFIFFMADHGGRTGKVRNSAIGEFEDNNPFLFMILPEALRSNRDLFDQLHENSKQILVHYDLYATMLEIATKSHEWTADTKFSTSTFEFNGRALKGSSMFHPLKQPRNCDFLLIPFNFCNCQHPSELIVDEQELAVRIGKAILERINNDVQTSQYADLCAELRLDTDFPIGLREYERGLHEDRRIFKIHFMLQPSGGLYEGFVEVRKGKVLLVNEQFPRLNLYKNQAFCIPQTFLRNYCYCKSLLKNGKKREKRKQ